MRLMTMLDPRNDIIQQHDNFVRRVVKKTISRYGLPSDGFDEYLTAAYMGLVEASERYDDSSGAPFEGYAYRRVRGAIIDSIRRNSDVTGSSYKALKAMRSLGPIEEEVSDAVLHIGDDMAVMQKIFAFAAKGFLAVRLHGSQQQEALTNIQDDADTPEQRMLRVERLNSLQRVVSRLPEKERYIVEQHYFAGKSFAEIIQDRPELSKSWVSRLHSRALDQLAMLIREKGGI